MVLLFLLWLLLGGALWFFLRRRLRLGSWLFLRMLLFLAIHPLLILLLRIWLPVWFRWRLLPLHLRWLLRLRPLLFLTLPNLENASQASNGLRVSINETRNRQREQTLTVANLVDHYLATELTCAQVDGGKSHATRTIYRDFLTRWVRPT